MTPWKMFFYLASFAQCWGYNSNVLETALALSSAAYCPKDDYNMINIAGSFEYDSTLYDKRSDLLGFVGRAPSQKTIYVALRGTSSPMNWFRDFEFTHVAYESFPECNCSVHKGFYLSARGVSDDAVESVRRLRSWYPTDAVVVVGHSYGASTGQLVAMELVKAGIPAQVYNFGQPRVGDSAYSFFMTHRVELVRVTHNRDIVPHVPPASLNYQHSAGEIFEDESGNLHECVGGEDPKCSQQYSLSQGTVDDHMVYLGQPVECRL